MYGTVAPAGVPGRESLTLSPERCSAAVALDVAAVGDAGIGRAKTLVVAIALEIAGSISLAEEDGAAGVGKREHRAKVRRLREGEVSAGGNDRARGNVILGQICGVV